jgi:hypothetical protein
VNRRLCVPRPLPYDSRYLHQDGQKSSPAEKRNVWTSKKMFDTLSIIGQATSTCGKCKITIGLINFIVIKTLGDRKND